MRPFNEVLREAQQDRPAVETSVATSIRGRKRGVRVVNPENITANPFSSGSTSTGGSSSRVRGFGDPKYYDAGKLKPDADLQYQRSIALGPLNRPGVRASDYPDWPDPNPRLKEIDRVAAAAAAGDKSAQARRARWQQEFDAYQAKNAVPGRQTRTRTSAKGRAADAAFFKGLGTPQEVAAAEQQFAIDYKKDLDDGKTTLGGKPVSPKRARINRTGLRDLALAVDKVDKTPSQVIANTQQSGRLKKVEVATKVEPPKGHNAKIRPGAKPAPATAPAAPRPVAPTPSKLETPKNLNQLVGQVKKSTPVTSARLTVPAVTTPVKAAPAVRSMTTAKVKPLKPAAATSAVSNARGMKALARGASAFAAYTDFKGGRKEVLDQGGGNRRADAAGVFRAAGGFLGGGLGFAAGTPAGPVGQTVTGTLGYQKGADLGTKLFKRLTGKPGDRVTSQSVLKNLKSTYKDVVPQTVRQNVPDVAKKGFTDFYNQAIPFAKKAYKAYRRFNKINDLTGGDK